MNGPDQAIEKWGCYECVLRAKSHGNPFTDVRLEAQFTNGTQCVTAQGFCDGDDAYIVRFMPETEGRWSLRTRSDLRELDGREGSFECVAASGPNHGPVRVHGSTNFAYADGTPYWPFGTTCYAWNHQGPRLEERTLRTLQDAPFNKLRMCVFPKRYRYNENEPESFPFEPRDGAGLGPEERWDFDRFHPPFFRKLERRILDLQGLGIEADLILFHPYDRGAWGFDAMPRGVNERYLRYLTARLSAFRNLWWSLANEYDLMRGISIEEWNDYFKIVGDLDPYGHMRSIHNCFGFFDHSLPWITHASIQSSQLDQADTLVRKYGKPVLFDECCYEGDIEMSWGDITAREMVHRFWLGFTRGAYVGHGETYWNPEQVLWWSKGGELRGESPARIAFLRSVLEESGLHGLVPEATGLQEYLHGFIQGGHDGLCSDGRNYFVAYFGDRQPGKRRCNLGEGSYRVDLIDTWDMTVQVLGTFRGSCEITLPGKPRIALRFVKTG